MTKFFNNKIMMVLIIMSVIIGSSTAVLAEITSFVTLDNNSNDYFEYEYEQLSASYSIWQNNQLEAKANLYKHFMENATNTRAIRNSKGEYISYEEISAQYSLAQSQNLPFDASSFVEEDDRTTYPMPEIIKRVSLNENDEVVIEDVVIGDTTEPSVTVAFTQDSLLNDGFALGKITANVRGVTEASKYAVKYTVSNASETKSVTTSKVKNGQATTDLVQYKDGTTIDILVYDVNDSPIYKFEGVEVN